MAVNLSRNTKVYLTTVDYPGDSSTVGASYTSANTFALPVLNGFAFSQKAESSTITLSEAGDTPIRGSRSFNTKLNPVDWNFSTYIRPFKNATKVSSIERILWNCLAGGTGSLGYINSAAVTITAVSTATTEGGTYVTATAGASHTMQVNDCASFYSTVVNELKGSFRVLSVPTSTTLVFKWNGPDNYTNVPAPTTTTLFKSVWHETTAYGGVSFAGSDLNTLEKFNLIFALDNGIYQVKNCAIDSADISFDINGIATIDWKGMGAVLSELAGTNSTAKSSMTTALGAITAHASATNYITNKLSTVDLYGASTLTGALGMAKGTKYKMALTGGSISIKNNIQYVTPEVLGSVNAPIGYFTGTRDITGSLNAYLRTGAVEGGTGALLDDMLKYIGSVAEPEYNIKVSIGGLANTLRVDLEMPSVALEVPSVDVQDVVSTTINFKAQGFTRDNSVNKFDVESTNSLTIKYYAP